MTAPYITGLAGTPGAGYFTDNNGHPRLWVASETWGIILRAGQWTSPAGNWQSDYDNFFTARSAQGVTVTMVDPIGPGSADTSDGPPAANGVTWDGIAPFTSGSDPASGLNNTYWERIDYMLNSARSNGITIGLAFNSNYDATSGGAMNGWTTSQYQAYGAAIGARYASQPNVVWLFGNDAYPGTYDTTWNAILTGLRGAGANQLTGAWWEAEYTSRYETDNNTAATWGVTNADFNFCYTYNAAYWIIEYAYNETSPPDNQAHLLPAVIGDGYFYQGGSTYSSTLDRAVRQEAWWALADGARGFLTESEAVYTWASTSLAAVSTHWFWVHNLPNIVRYYTSLRGWHLLLPDLASSLVTAGRGTKVSGYTAGGGGGQYEPGFTNNWVAASITPDGSLAVIYMPLASTITVNQSLLTPGYEATWVDPVTCATYAATAGSTYASGSPDGAKPASNSQGDPDWVLVLATPDITSAGSGHAAPASSPVVGVADIRRLVRS